MISMTEEPLKCGTCDPTKLPKSRRIRQMFRKLTNPATPPITIIKGGKGSAVQHPPPYLPSLNTSISYSQCFYISARIFLFNLCVYCTRFLVSFQRIQLHTLCWKNGVYFFLARRDISPIDVIRYLNRWPSIYWMKTKAIVFNCHPS